MFVSLFWELRDGSLPEQKEIVRRVRSLFALADQFGGRLVAQRQHKARRRGTVPFLQEAKPGLA